MGQVCFAALHSILFISDSCSRRRRTVLSGSISGCHAADEKNKIKNRAREKRDLSPRLKRRGNLNRFIQRNESQQKGRFVSDAKQQQQHPSSQHPSEARPLDN